MSNELIHDIEESIRRERINALWKEYGPYLIGGVAIAVVLTAGISGVRHWRNTTNAANTKILVEALATEDGQTALALESATTELKGGPKALAWLSEAGIHLRDDKKEEALAIFEKAAADKKLPGIYQDLAILQAVRLTADMKKDVKAEDLLDRLLPIVNDNKNPWRFHAALQAALLNAQSLGDYVAAEKFLTIIKDDKFAPQLLKNKADALSQLYELPAYREQNQPAAAAKKEESQG